MYKFLVLCSVLAAAFDAAWAASASDCLLPITGGGGGCGRPVQKYGYNIESETCVSFTTTSCEAPGRGNRFDTEDECLDTCQDITICNLPKDTGVPCGPPMQRYVYNAASSACEAVIVGRCGGNANSFTTQQDCEDKCVQNK